MVDETRNEAGQEWAVFDLDPDFDRLRTTLLVAGEPDRVPTVELLVDREIKEAFLGRPLRNIQDDVEFWYRAGYDYIHIRAGYEYRMVGDGDSVSSATYAGDFQVRRWDASRETWCNSWEEYDAYPWPDPETIDYSPVRLAAGALPEGMKVISGVGGIFTRVWRIMGYENFCYGLVDQPELVATLFRRVGETQLTVFERIVEMDGIGAMWYGDDLAYTEGMMVSPQVLREHMFPYLREMGRICQRKDLPFILHSDGYLWPIMDDLLEIGFNAIHPIEPKAMDLGELKEKLGHRLCFLGAIDLGEVLTRGDPTVVDEAVRQRIRDTAPGGGYGVGSSNTVAHWVPMENYVAMLVAARKYGQYPIDLA
jgi:uroporphyrinogen decarboxylase